MEGVIGAGTAFPPLIPRSEWIDVVRDRDLAQQHLADHVGDHVSGFLSDETNNRETCRRFISPFHQARVDFSDNSIQKRLFNHPDVSAQSLPNISGCYRSVTDFRGGVWPTI